MDERHDQRWAGRPALSAALRTISFATPILLSAWVSVRFVRELPPAGGVQGVLGRWAAAFVVSTVVLYGTDRITRRLMPLAVLLRLSLVFPDRAPSRWKLARKATSVKHLEEVAERARRRGVADEPARAAEHILTLVAAVEAHDRGTRGHSERVRIYTDLIAEELKLPKRARDKLRWASLLHDVGKLMVPKEVLNKPSKLDDGEWEVVKRHPEEGARFTQPLRAFLGEWARAIEEHHERFDGGGYPRALAGEQLSLAGRIVCVADSYEVMTARRAYRRPMRARQARAELVKCAGSQFDPHVVRAFLQISIGRLRLVSGPLSWLAQTPFLPSFQQAATAGAAATAGGAMILGLMPPAAPPSHDEAVRARPDAEVLITLPDVEPTRVSAPVSRPTFTPQPIAIAPSPVDEPSAEPTPKPSRLPAPERDRDPTPEPSPSPSVALDPGGGTIPVKQPDEAPSSAPEPEPTLLPVGIPTLVEIPGF